MRRPFLPLALAWASTVALAAALAACGGGGEPPLPNLPDLFAIAEGARATHPDEAPELLMVAAELDERPRDARSLARAAVLAKNVGRLEASEALFDRALALAPDDPEVLYRRGRTKLDLRDLDAAVPLLERARELDLERLEHHLALGEAYALLGRDEDAIAAYERARELAPGSVEATYELALLVEFGDPERALRLLGEIVSRDPYHLGAHANMVSLLERQGNESAAERAREEHVELALLSDLGVLDRAEEADRYLAQAQYYAKHGRTEDAERVAREGLEQHPRHPEVHFLAGVLAVDAGRKVEARDRFLSSLELRPDTERVLLALAALYAKEDPPGARPEVRELLEAAAVRWPGKKRFARALRALDDE